MEQLLEVWKEICESNLFNFVVMLLLLGWIIKKCNISQIIENGRKKIEDTINNSEKNKNKSLENLFAIQDEVTDIDKKMFIMFEKAEKNAKEYGEKLLKDVDIQKGLIKDSSRKTIDSFIESAKNSVLSETAEKALSLAEIQIIEELKKNPDLHFKFINESIEEISKI